jgi:uncharacterized repeat protein (TIGR03803 family)
MVNERDPERTGRAPVPAPRERKMLRSLACICAVVSCLAASEVRGQNYTVIHAFSGEGGVPYAGLTQGPDGRLYGTTAGGGLFGQGSVYVLTPNGSGFDFSDLYSFSGALDGGDLRASLLLANDGNLYGTTYTGGSANFGTVFRIDTAGNLESIYAFQSGLDGSHPSAGLIQASDGYLYGVASDGGQTIYGTVFRLDLVGNLTTLHNFQGGLDGAFPLGTLFEGSPGLLYGTTSSSGASGVGYGTIYSITTSGLVATLWVFEGSDGANPAAGLVPGPNGYLYGTTEYGGYGNGTVFGFEPPSSLLVNHPLSFSEGLNPVASLLLGSDGNLYGTTNNTLFQFTGGGTLTVIHSFSGPDGSDVVAPLIQLSDGLLYGTAAIGGFEFGTVFRLETTGDGFETLHEFGAPHANFPFGPLFQAPDGSIYGTASGGSGAVFRLDEQGNETDLHIFSGPDGETPDGLVRSANGTLYGSTFAGGDANLGTAFSIDTANAFSVVHLFTQGDGPSASGLTLAADGTLYGATRVAPSGSIYHIDSIGAFSTIYALSGADGSLPLGDLLQMPDGTFIGVTSGDDSGDGTAFRVDTEGNFTNLHSFSGWDGKAPVGRFVLAPDGNLYGVTQQGGAANDGVIYRMSPAGFVTVLHSFTGADGAGPVQGMTLAEDGYLYGGTEFGGANGVGAVFRCDGSGNVVTIHSFELDTGEEPESPMFQGRDGGLYGAALIGGLLHGGVVFRITLQPALSVWGIVPSSGPAMGGSPVTVNGAGFDLGASLSIGGAPATGVSFVSSSEIAGVAPPLPPGTLNDVMVTDFSGLTGTFSKAWISDFLDVPQADIFHASVVRVFRDGISAGCGAGYYCRDSAVSREQIAVLLLRSEHGPSYVPPACTGVFADVPCPSQYADWIEQLAAEGITGGCGGGNYCPGSPVSRAQTAVFLLKAFHGSTYQPPACTGVFVDVECTPSPAFAVDWIEELYHEGVTGGCSTSPLKYCPDQPNSRGQMAVFLVKTFTLP